MTVGLIQYGSSQYEEMISLRVTSLLKPIGVPASYIDRESKKNDLLIGALEDGQMIGGCLLTPRKDGIV